MSREFVDITEAAALLKEGGMLLLDTDTVAGIAVSTSRPDALALLYNVKDRDRDKPIAWLVSSESDLDKYGDNIPEYARLLARTFWPGGLTLIVKASPAVDSVFASDDGTIALRMPNDSGCIALAETLGSALATTSANASGTPAPAFLSDIDPNFAEGVACLDASSAGVPASPSNVKGVKIPKAGMQPGLPSTIIDCTGARPCLKREGAIPFSDIEKALNANLGDISCE